MKPDRVPPGLVPVPLTTVEQYRNGYRLIPECLLGASHHPKACKNSIPYSQFLRLRRICSSDDDFIVKSDEMVEFFEKNGYPRSLNEPNIKSWLFHIQKL